MEINYNRNYIWLDTMGTIINTNSIWLDTMGTIINTNLVRYAYVKESTLYVHFDANDVVMYAYKDQEEAEDKLDEFMYVWDQSNK